MDRSGLEDLTYLRQTQMKKKEEQNGSASQDRRDDRNFLYPHGDPVGD
jgi:hypothetical protein